MQVILSIIAGVIIGRIYFYVFDEGYPKFILFVLFILHMEVLFLIQTLL